MFSTKAQVTLILHTARSKNEMNMAVDKWIKCLKFIDLVSPVKLNSFCPHSIHRKHTIMQDTNIHSHNYIQLSLQGLWNLMFIRHVFE